MNKSVNKSNKLKNIKPDVALMSHYRATIKNLSFIRSQILNLSISKAFEEVLLTVPKSQTKTSNSTGVYVQKRDQ